MFHTVVEEPWVKPGEGHGPKLVEIMITWPR